MSDENPADPQEQPPDALAVAHRRIDELARAYQAAEHDRVDFKRRLERERERMLEIEKAEVAMMLIEVIDDLDLCLSSSEDSALFEGVKLIRDKVVSQLESKEIERLELLGEKYNPQLAEAADLEVTADREEDGAIVAVLRAGYRHRDRVIRPARVKVARFVQPADA